MVKPYYRQGGITIYCGDAREIMPALSWFDTVYADPVWPNALPILAGADRPWELFAEIAGFVPYLSDRLIVQLGCDSDPRFLAGVPDRLPFFRVCSLEFVRPIYKGRLLYTGDVGYVFGRPPPAKPGAMVLPGRYMPIARDRRYGHPCPRKLDHVVWLLNWFTAGRVLDPCMGSGTSLEAALLAGREAVGIDIREEYCEMAVRRLSQAIMALDMVSTE